VTIQFDIRGAAEIERVLKRLPQEVARKELTGAVMDGANIVRRAWRDAAPVRTDATPKPIGKGGRGRLPGFLKANIRRGVVKFSDASVTVAVGTGRAFYAFFREFGTRHQPAVPWARPAWENAAPAALAQIGISLGKRVERAAARLASFRR
jgi:HK97 gp10 family phage protein